MKIFLYYFVFDDLPASYFFFYLYGWVKPKHRFQSGKIYYNIFIVFFVPSYLSRFRRYVGFVVFLSEVSNFL